VVDSNDANGLSWLLTNHQGSPTDTLDPVSGYPLTDMRFTAWGQTRLTSGPVDEDRMPTQQRYTGQYQDDDIPDLYFYNARWYDAQPGRFLQADTLVPGMDGLAWDRYAYARNSPVVYSDPSGHKACDNVGQGKCETWTLDRELELWRIGKNGMNRSEKEIALEAAYRTFWRYTDLCVDSEGRHDNLTGD